MLAHLWCAKALRLKAHLEGLSCSSWLREFVIGTNEGSRNFSANCDLERSAQTHADTQHRPTGTHTQTHGDTQHGPTGTHSTDPQGHTARTHGDTHTDTQRPTQTHRDTHRPTGTHTQTHADPQPVPGPARPAPVAAAVSTADSAGRSRRAALYRAGLCWAGLCRAALCQTGPYRSVLGRTEPACSGPCHAGQGGVRLPPHLSTSTGYRGSHARPGPPASSTAISGVSPAPRRPRGTSVRGQGAGEPQPRCGPGAAPSARAVAAGPSRGRPPSRGSPREQQRGRRGPEGQGRDGVGRDEKGWEGMGQAAPAQSLPSRAVPRRALT